LFPFVFAADRIAVGLFCGRFDSITARGMGDGICCLDDFEHDVGQSDCLGDATCPFENSFETQ
jgi:hypothetical protein